MKYFSILVILTGTLISVEGKIPDYIQVCKRNNPQINKCIRTSILNLREKLVEGIPELNVPSIDPLRLEKLSLNLGRGFLAEGRDLLLRGGRNFSIQNVAVDTAASSYSFEVAIPEVVATGSYEINANLAGIPLRGRGPLTLTARSVTGRGTLYSKSAVRRGLSYRWFPKLEMKLGIKDYNIDLENLFDGNAAIGEVTNKLLNEEKAEVLASFLPGLEKALIEHILLTGNNIVSNFTWDELFPES